MPLQGWLLHLLPKRLEPIPADEILTTLSADGASDTRAGHAATAGGEATALVGAPVHWTRA